MAPDSRDDLDNETLVLRTLLLVGVLAAIVVALLAFQDGRQRIAEAAADASLGRNARAVVVTQPVDPVVFPDSVVWELPSSKTDLQIDDDVPVARVSASADGALYGLETASGIVALALVPPGLDPIPGELLISPESTALALAGLHPDVLAPDPAAHRARLAAVATAPSFAALVAQVDGRPLAQWSEAERGTLQRVVGESLSTEISVPCAETQVIDGPVSLCLDDGSLLNASRRSIVVADESGAACAIVPGAATAPTLDGDALLFGLAGAGTLAPVGLDPAGPGRLDASACGDAPTVVAGDGTALAQANRAAVFADVAVPIARLLGADDSLAAPTTIDDALAEVLVSNAVAVEGQLDAATQLRIAAAFFRDPGAVEALGLLPVGESTLGPLDDLVDLLATVYS